MRIGRLPIIKQALELIYKYIAYIRHYLLGQDSGIYWVKTTLILAFLSGIFLSPKLWGFSRLYPRAPVFSFLEALIPIENLLLMAFVGVLLFALLIKNPKKYLLSVALLMGIFWLGDQSRLQPWAYQYTIMLGVLSLDSWKLGSDKRRDRILNICRIIIACIYFWSGLQTANASFILGVYPWFVSPLTKFMPNLMGGFTESLGFLPPLMEMAIGICLLTRRFRNFAVAAAVGMHLFILFSLGPFGHNWNNIIWPWNIAMICFDIILFWKVKSAPWKSYIQKAYLPVILLFGFLPILSFYNLWDSYPSFTLYSGNIKQGYLSINRTVKDKLPAGFGSYLRENKNNKYDLDIYSWSMKELNVPSYPENRVYKSITKEICKYSAKDDDVVLVVWEMPNALTGRRSISEHTCSTV